MRLAHSLITTAVAAFASASSAIAVPAQPNALTSGEQAVGWRLLFDGQTLAGWRAFKSEAPPAGWQAIDGELVRTEKSGDLVSVAEFGDFELTLQWKNVDGGNSGIMYRVGLGEPRTIHTGPEFQILDAALIPVLVGKGMKLGPQHTTGAIADVVPPIADVARPNGVWNDTRIVVRAWRVEHWLNGTKIVDVDLDSPSGRERIAGSKFGVMPKFATLARGRIALQDHDGRVSFRAIKIRELAPVVAPGDTPQRK